MELWAPRPPSSDSDTGADKGSHLPGRFSDSDDNEQCVPTGEPSSLGPPAPDRKVPVDAAHLRQSQQRAHVASHFVSGDQKKPQSAAHRKKLEEATDLATLERLVQRDCMHCSRRCFKQFVGEISLIKDFRQQFRSMTDVEQSIAIAEMAQLSKCDVQDSPPEPLIGQAFGDSDPDPEPLQPSCKRRKTKKRGGRPKKGEGTKWSFQGKPVCKPSLCDLMGISEKRWDKSKQGKVDGRRGPRLKGPDGAPVCYTKMTHVKPLCTFMWHMWASAAEGMPNRMILKNKNEERQSTKVEWKSDRPQKPSVSVVVDVFGDSDSDVDDSDGCGDLNFCTAASESGCEDDEKFQRIQAACFRDIIEEDNMQGIYKNWHDAPKRWLPPGKKIQVYWQYIRHCEDHDIAKCSWSTFKRYWKKIFRHKLGFRKVSEHSKCDCCEGYERELKHAVDMAARLMIAGMYSEHLHDQWLDRTIYWKRRAIARLCAESFLAGRHLPMGVQSLMVIVIDGMDQAKFRCPRMQGPPTKDSDDLLRPAMHVTGTWVHGAGLLLSVSEPDLAKDSNFNQECLARALNRNNNNNNMYCMCLCNELSSMQ